MLPPNSKLRPLKLRMGWELQHVHYKFICQKPRCLVKKYQAMLGSGMLVWLTSGSYTPQFSPSAYYTSPNTFSNISFNSLAQFGLWQCLISPWSLPGWQQMQTREQRVSPATDRALPSHGCYPSLVTMGLWQRRRSRDEGQLGPERVLHCLHSPKEGQWCKRAFPVPGSASQR